MAGFKPRSFFRRPAGGGDKDAATQDRTVQWIFSDGLASVSLFIERYDAKRAPRDGVLTIGATNAIRRRLPEPASDWWLTAVGEVPQSDARRLRPEPRTHALKAAIVSAACAAPIRADRRKALIVVSSRSSCSLKENR